jgi:Do/DeqQ family serine protease
MHRTWLIFSQAVTVALAILFVVATLKPEWLQERPFATLPSAMPASALRPAALGPGAGLVSASYAAAAQRAAPAVVSVITSKSPISRGRQSEDPWFRYFFGEPGNPAQSGIGSGVIVSADGYVLTNNHVLGQGALQQVTVILSDRRERPAKLVGIDPTTDLALLKIAERNLPAVTWGDSGQLKVAEWVLAVGNPYQLGQTVTLGIVSGLNRSYEDVSSIVDYIQTDAAINPGNSGGALINRRGELVGINTWIYSQSGGDQGIGFAIPSNIARRVSEEIIRTGEVKRGTIGEIQLASVTPALARDLGLTDTKGALVWNMYRTASAYRAGLRPGDVIVAVDGKPIETPREFQRALAELPIGRVMTLGILREGARREIKVQIEQQQARTRAVAE